MKKIRDHQAAWDAGEPTLVPPTPLRRTGRAPGVRRSGALASGALGTVLMGLPASGAEIVSAVARGLEFERLEQLGTVLRLSPYDVAASIHLSSSTYLRRRKEGRLQPDESDRLVRLGQVVAQAVALFEGDTEAASRWLQRPARALGGATPLKFAETHVGAQEVEDLIGRLEHGVFA